MWKDLYAANFKFYNGKEETMSTFFQLPVFSLTE